MIIQLLAHVLTSTIRSHKLYSLVELILNLVLKLSELFKSFRLVPHQIDISISTQVVGKSHEVLIATSGSCAHWTTHITMYKFQQLGCPLATLCERRLSHLAEQA